jgi:hypothetical protein
VAIQLSSLDEADLLRSSPLRAVELTAVTLLALLVGACGRSELLPEPPDAGDSGSLGDGSLGLDCPSGELECKGACIDTQTDNRNCGRCGGVCSATAPSTAQCVAGRCLVTLYTGTSEPYDLAIDAKAVYWTGYSNVMKVPLGGGKPAALASGPGYGIAVDSKNVYWAVDTFANVGAITCVLKVPLNGGAVTSILQPGTESCTPMGLAINGDSVYWTNDARGTVMRAPLQGGKSTTLASGEDYPNGIAVDATSVYWVVVNEGTVVKAPLGGGKVTVLASGQTIPSRLTVNATSVYWTNWGTYDSSYTDGTVVQVPLSGGAPTTLASGQFSPNGIAVDASDVYWTNFGDGTVMKVSRGGGSPVILASGGSGPWDVAVDDTSVYWTERGGVTGKGASLGVGGSDPPGAVRKLTPK